MSVILVSLDAYARLRLTMTALMAQTARRGLEIVIVAPSSDSLNLEEGDMQEFHSFQVVDIGTIRSTGGAVAAGFQRARASVVAYAEEHSYPFPTWAEALLRAHQKPWGAVGAAVANANPGALSWAHLFADFGPCVKPASGGITSHLAWHHVSYKRELLSEYDLEQLGDLLETEGFLLRAIENMGRQLYFEPAAESNHVNASTFHGLIQCEFLGGRLFAAARVRHEAWSPARRLLYMLGSPLVPLLRLGRTVREMRRAGRFDQLVPQILPGVLTALLAHCFGEILGYAVGRGDAARHRIPCELNRVQFAAISRKKAARP